MIRNRIFVKFICVLLLASFLTLNVGKVQRASAIGITAATAAGAALCAVGVVYCSYMILTNASVHIPNENVQDWLQDMGSKVSQYPSGHAAYEEFYSEYIRYPSDTIADIFDDVSSVWTWTADKIKAWTNDFSDSTVIESIATFEQLADLSNIPLNGFDYPFTIISIPELIEYNGNIYTFDAFHAATGYLNVRSYTGKLTLDGANDVAWFVNSTLESPVRNVLQENGKYRPQYYNGSTWLDLPSNVYYGLPVTNDGGAFFGTGLALGHDEYLTYSASRYSVYSGELDYPIFPNEQIYDETNDYYYPLDVPEGIEVVQNPEWPVSDDDEDFHPPAPIPTSLVPFDPAWINPVTGTPGGGNWGFNLNELLDLIENISTRLIQIGSIAELINRFKNSLTGTTQDAYYIYFNEGDDYYYNYYNISSPTYYGDTTYYTYEIDVSDIDEKLPVDLNSINQYTNNNYISTVKNAAERGSSIIGDLVVFWHNVDPEIIYTLFGCAIITLIAAFIGKWGHS